MRSQVIWHQCHPALNLVAGPLYSSCSEASAGFEGIRLHLTGYSHWIQWYRDMLMGHLNWTCTWDRCLHSGPVLVAMPSRAQIAQVAHSWNTSLQSHAKVKAWHMGGNACGCSNNSQHGCQMPLGFLKWGTPIYHPSYCTGYWSCLIGGESKDLGCQVACEDVRSEAASSALSMSLELSCCGSL